MMIQDQKVQTSNPVSVGRNSYFDPTSYILNYLTGAAASEFVFL